LRDEINANFINEFSKGLQKYYDGDWRGAKEHFMTVSEIKGSLDGPSNVLLEFIDS
jgi:hypothetical protein